MLACLLASSVLSVLARLLVFMGSSNSCCPYCLSACPTARRSLGRSESLCVCVCDVCVSLSPSECLSVDLSEYSVEPMAEAGGFRLKMSSSSHVDDTMEVLMATADEQAGRRTDGRTNERTTGHSVVPAFPRSVVQTGPQARGRSLARSFAHSVDHSLSQQDGAEQRGW